MPVFGYFLHGQRIPNIREMNSATICVLCDEEKRLAELCSSQLIVNEFLPLSLPRHIKRVTETHKMPNEHNCCSKHGLSLHAYTSSSGDVSTEGWMVDRTIRDFEVLHGRNISNEPHHAFHISNEPFKSPVVVLWPSRRDSLLKDLGHKSKYCQ